MANFFPARRHFSTNMNRHLTYMFNDFIIKLNVNTNITLIHENLFLKVYANYF